MGTLETRNQHIMNDINSVIDHMLYTNQLGDTKLWSLPSDTKLLSCYEKLSRSDSFNRTISYP